MGVAAWFAWLEDEGQPKVGDAGRHVWLDKDVFRLEVSVGDGRFHVQDSAGAEKRRVSVFPIK